MDRFILALDQGTTSTRAMLFSSGGAASCISRFDLKQSYPHPGWVEHDAMEIMASALRVMSQTVERSGLDRRSIAGIGIANQRETTIVWDRETGVPVCPAIVWQCRRTAALCEAIVRRGLGERIRRVTGLTPDAYFSATKLMWILDNIPMARQRAERGGLLFGTVESWLIWNLTGEHVTDHSNACRTMLFDIHNLRWDDELCAALDIPMRMLPRPVENSAVFGRVKPGLPGLEALAGVPVCGSAGDQQAALFGQGCFERGMAKNTYGTGCFALMNTGGVPANTDGMLTSVGWTLEGTTSYVIEGSVFNAGSAIQWLRDEMGLITAAGEINALAARVPDSGGVYMVPAFTGLGAPHWDMYARGTIVGLTRGSGAAHLARAVLEGIAFQVAELIEAMERESGGAVRSLWVDGGASQSDLLMQFQADILAREVNRPRMIETTAAGAAYFAGLACGVWDSTRQISAMRQVERRFEPDKPKEHVDKLMYGWRRAVERARGWEEKDVIP